MSGSNLLAIDTSGSRLQLALARQGWGDTLVEEIAKGHAEILFDRIASLLARHDLAYADLSRIAVTTGPGSFTGLRIGIAAARGLGLSLDLPVIGVPNLLALSLSAQSGPVDIRLDARRDEFYVQRFTAPGQPETLPELIGADKAESFPRKGVQLITDPQVNITLMAQFALQAAPADYPPDPAYVRAADAKPQTGKQVPRQAEKAP